MIPDELTTLPQWVVAGSNKVPLNPRSLHAASVTDSRTWGTYQQACATAQQHGLYIGFVFTAEDPFVGIDLDAPETAEQVTRHQTILKEFNTYTETSVSGKGVHLICKGRVPHAAKRDRVEVYDRERYFIITGNTLPNRPTNVADCNGVVTQLVQEMAAARKPIVAHTEPEKNTDQEVLDKCSTSANGDKFRTLWAGNWQQGYSSQSEADYALVNMLAFVSPNNEQCKRLFRHSALGQRSKANREDYLDTMIGRIRGEQHPPVDFSNFKPPPFTPEQTPRHCEYPDGLIGEVAQYILETAIRPVPQVALAGALGLVAGIAGRAYNINHMGLNLYIMLVAGTAIGKEGAAQGVHRIIKATRPKLPSIEQFIGPTEYASGQALIKQLQKQPCQLSILSEFGHTLKRICSPHAIGADIMWRKVLLDVYNKSGHNDILGSMVYSDTGKNTPVVIAPALTLLTESSPASLYEGLDEQGIEIGLVPRFLLLECDNTRPPSNPNAFAAPPQALTARVEGLAQRCLSMQANNTHQPITLSSAAEQMLAAFDKEVDKHINAHNEDSVRQIWSRAHMKALRIAGLVTVGLGPDSPVVHAPAAEWAVSLVRVDAQNMLKRFGEGVGMGDPVQLAKLRSALVNCLQANRGRLMSQHNVVTHRQLSQRVYPLACYRNDRRGAGEALRRAIQAMIDGGELVMLSAQQAREYFKTSAKCYAVTNSFSTNEEQEE